MAPFYFDPEFPVDLRPAVQAMLPPLAPLVPRWCQRVRICFGGGGRTEDGSGTITAQVSTDFPYRNACISISGEWFADTAIDRERGLRHEVMHIILCPLADWARDTLKRLVSADAPILAQQLKVELYDRVEGVTQDLSDCVERLVAG